MFKVLVISSRIVKSYQIRSLHLDSGLSVTMYHWPLTTVSFALTVNNLISSLAYFILTW